MTIKTVSVKDFKYGLITALESRSIKRGAASSSLNWQTKGDRIELRRGQRFLGSSSVNNGLGKAIALKKATNALGVEILFGTYNKKLKYYTTTAGEWTEIGSDLLGASVVSSSTGFGNELISLSEYVSPAGNQMWINSPNCAGFFKIMVANPGDYTDMYSASKNFKGNIKIDTNRTFLWGRTADKTGVYGSYIDEQDYTSVDDEVGWYGNGSSTSFTRMLDFKTKATGTLTSSGVNVSDGDTVVLGAITYRFKNTMAQAYDVKIGADAAASLVNLKHAINQSGTAGTHYFAGTLAHTTIEARAITSTTLVVQAKTGGTSGNSLASTETAATLSFGGTPLSGGAANTKTCFGLTVAVAGGITFTEDYNGTLTGSDGTSTGTINYTTGVIALTFTSAPAAGSAITIDYQHEDSNNNGISDFTKSAPRTAGQGFVFRQDEGGGPVQNVNVYSSIYFCMHLKKTWALNIGSDDTSATNLPYRDRVGIPNKLASVETGDGVFYIDDQNPDDVKARLLTYSTSGSEQVVPVPVSNNLDLNAYRFDQAAAHAWGNLVLFACRRESSTVNDRVLVYDKLWKSWDILDYNVNVFETFEGTLVAGDSISNNFLELFSGFDDFEGDSIENYWIGSLDELDTEGLKASKKLYLQGVIAPDQSLDVYIAVDNGSFSRVATIEGSGDYVDRGNAVSIGAAVIGKNAVGGGSSDTTAYNYERLVSLQLGKFERIQIKFVATALGYVSVSDYRYWDVRFKGKRVPQRYRG